MCHKHENYASEGRERREGGICVYEWVTRDDQLTTGTVWVSRGEISSDENVKHGTAWASHGSDGGDVT